jgi:hypothetical protein
MGIYIGSDVSINLNTFICAAHIGEWWLFIAFSQWREKRKKQSNFNLFGNAREIKITLVQLVLFISINGTRNAYEIRFNSSASVEQIWCW